MGLSGIMSGTMGIRGIYCTVDHITDNILLWTTIIIVSVGLFAAAILFSCFANYY